MPEPPGTPQKAALPPMPMIFERDAPEEMSLRTYAAIMLRVPESGIDWLDKMILRSRELDRAS